MADAAKVWRCAVIANWGIGAVLLKSLLMRSDVDIRFVVTTFENGSADRWRNAVADEAFKAGVLLFHEDQLSFEQLEQLLRDEGIDLILAHAGKRILPKDVLSVPKQGSINFHPSLLPRHRGPAPTWWVLRNKEQETGITSHFMDEGIDTGPIIATVVVPVKCTDTVESVIDSLKRVLPKLLHVTLEKLGDPDFMPEQQDENLAAYESHPSHDYGEF